MNNTELDRELFNPERQSMGPETLAKFQRQGLEKEWKRIWEQPIPFYKNKFEAAGLSAKELPPLDEIPMTIKDELRADDAANPPWGTWRAMSVDDASCLGASTGTTGKPMLYLRGKKDMEIYREVVQRNWWREGLRPGGRTTNSWPGYIYSAMGGSVGSIWHWPAMEIPVGPPMNLDMAKEHIALWQSLRPTNYMMSGSQLQIYEQAAQEMGTGMAQVFNGANVAFMEAMCQFEEPRKHLEERFNMHIFNISGASELPGAAVTDCKYHTGFHTHADHVIAQVVDPATGREVAPGGRGHLVWSAIGGSSFWLRYNVEDWAESVPGTCPCGETGLRYRLLGRGGDLQVIGGKQLFPLDVQLALEPFGAPEFLVEKGKKPDTLCVKVETAGDGTDLTPRSAENARGERRSFADSGWLAATRFLQAKTCVISGSLSHHCRGVVVRRRGRPVYCRPGKQDFLGASLETVQRVGDRRAGRGRWTGNKQAIPTTDAQWKVQNPTELAETFRRGSGWLWWAAPAIRNTVPYPLVRF